MLCTTALSLCVWVNFYCPPRAPLKALCVLFYVYIYIFIIPLFQLIIDECLYLRAVDFSPIYCMHWCVPCCALLHCHYDYFMINLIVEINNINGTQSKVDLRDGSSPKNHYRYWSEPCREGERERERASRARKTQWDMCMPCTWKFTKLTNLHNCMCLCYRGHLIGVYGCWLRYDWSKVFPHTHN